MNRDKVKLILEELDREVPTEEAILRIHKQTKPYGNILLGNETGLMRFGIESMKCALYSKSGSEEAVQSFENTEFDFLQGDELEMYCFKRNDRVEKLTLEQSREETRLQFNAPTRIYIWAFLIVFALLMFVGVFTVVNWGFALF